MAESADRVAIAFDPAQIRKAQDRNPFVKISDIVYDILSEAILSSTIAPGSKLNISSIAENLNISHTPVFQAVDRLKNSGLIVESNETSKYHSYRVLDISNESLTNLFTARKAIETTAASICATNVALIDIAQLKKMAAEFRTVWSLYANGRGTSADFADRETLDRAFHIPYCPSEKSRQSKFCFRLVPQNYPVHSYRKAMWSFDFHSAMKNYPQEELLCFRKPQVRLSLIQPTLRRTAL